MVTLTFVAVLLAAFLLDALVIRPWEAKHLPRPVADVDAELEFAVPRALFFHPGHLWARFGDDGRVTVGIDDLARTLIGDLSTVELPSVGERLVAGRPAAVVRLGDRRIALVAPVSGRVTDSNRELGRDSIRLRWRPYKEGWLYRLEPGAGVAREIASLKIGKDAAAWMEAEIERVRRLFDEGHVTPPVEGALGRGTEEARSSFEAAFFVSAGKPEEVSA